MSQIWAKMYMARLQIGSHLLMKSDAEHIIIDNINSLRSCDAYVSVN